MFATDNRLRTPAGAGPQAVSSHPALDLPTDGGHRMAERAKLTALRELLVNRGGAGTKKRPLTIRALHARTGYSIGHLSDVVAGKKLAGDRLIAELARTLQTPITTIRQAAEVTFRESARGDG